MCCSVIDMLCVNLTSKFTRNNGKEGSSFSELYILKTHFCVSGNQFSSIKALGFRLYGYRDFLLLEYFRLHEV